VSPGVAGPEPDVRLRPVETAISRVLFWGGVASISIVVIGLSAYLVQGHLRAHVASLAQLREGRAAGVYVSVGEIWRGLRRRPTDPLAIVAGGLLLLMVTPIAGVGLAVAAFASIGDREYVIISTLILAILLLSLVLGGTG